MWFVPFLSGLVAGVILTFVVTGGLRKYREAKSRAPFEIRVLMTTRPAAAYVVEAQGDIRNRGDEVSYVLNLQDRTDGSVSSILFKNEGVEKAHETLTVNGPTLQVGPRERLDEWTRIVTLPIERVSFSRQGERLLNFSLSVDGAPVKAEATFLAEQEEAGFVEVREKLPEIYASIWYLILGLRSDFPEHSALILERAAEFLVKESETWPEEIRSDIFASFKEIAENETSPVSCEEACSTYAVNLQTTADKATRDDVMRLFYTLLIEEGGLNVDSEDALIVFYNLCVGIGVDMGAFTRLVDRYILTHDLKNLPSGCMLGLYVGMDLKAAKSRLMEEYKKWNPRITHSDENIRERAKHMLELISAARVALK